MKKCLRIQIVAQFSGDYLRNVVLKHARKLQLEGTAQLKNGQKEKEIFIKVCGPGDKLDDFIDIFHNGPNNFKLVDIQIAPFLKDKDYREVFRIIE